MLSSITASMIPQSVAELFVPALDSRALQMSLLSGQLQLSGLVLNADKFNALVLAEPASPLRLVRGSLDSLALSVDWKHLLSAPLLLTLSGLKMVLTHARIRGGAAAAAGLAARTQGQWKEEELLKIFLDRKLADLEAAVPLEEQESKEASSGGGGGWFGAPLKKLFTLALNSVTVKIENVEIEFDALEDVEDIAAVEPEDIKGTRKAATEAEEPAQAAAEKTLTTPAPSIRSHFTPVMLGFQLAECTFLETNLKQVRANTPRRSSRHEAVDASPNLKMPSLANFSLVFLLT